MAHRTGKHRDSRRQAPLSLEQVHAAAEANREVVNRVGRANLQAQYEALQCLDLEDGPWVEGTCSTASTKSQGSS